MEAPTAPLRSISIAPTTDAKGKSRSFSAQLLAIVAANSLWPFGETAPDGTLRPVLVAYAASDLQARAFTANLRAGRPARSTNSRPGRLRFEIPRSAGFRFETHSADGATLTLAYQPTVFAMQPGGLEDGRLRFLAMPPTWWVDREAETLADLGAEAREAALAAYFVAYLDRHSPYPIANDRRFHLALYRAALATDWCHAPSGSPSHSGRLYAEGSGALGFESPLAVSTSRATFSAFLAEITAQHLPKELTEEASHGKTRVRRQRRILPVPDLAPAGCRVAG